MRCARTNNHIHGEHVFHTGLVFRLAQACGHSSKDKKPRDPLDIKSYRPISNLSLVSKTVEWLVVNRMNVHANQYGLLPARQSAYRQHHSTETAVTIVHNDIVRSTDAGFMSALVLLDLSTAFNTVDHGILLKVLAKRFGVENLELDWFRSYHTGCTQTFTTPSGSSAPVALTSSVPQGLVIGPKEFIIFTEDIKETIDRFIINHHLYADDSQFRAHTKIKQLWSIVDDWRHASKASGTGVPDGGCS